VKTFHTVAIALSLGVLGLTGCSSGGGAGFGEAGKPAPEKDPDPVTLKLFTHQPMTADDFRLLIAEPVKKKYPYITVELLEHNATMLENAVASKEQIDLITIWNGNMNPNKGLGLFEDITPLAKSEQFDLARFDPDALRTLRTLGDNGELYGLPYNMQFNALYYNKDLFDKFGAAYPQDGMTWDDVVQLAKRLTRIDGGIQYSGLGMDSWTRPVYPLSLIPVDARTNAAAVNSEPYRKAFTLGKMIYSIPGNAPNFSTNEFIKERKQAMLASVNLLDLLSKTEGLNWDIAQFPSYKESPDVFGMYDLHVIAITSMSRHKQAAMKALEVLFSDDNQKISTRKTGRVPLLTNPDIRKEFGADNPALKDKKLNSIFKSKPASAPPFSKYQSKGSEITLKHYKEFLADNKDLNTMLRDAEEEINQFIKSQQ